jgi:hypothetical protein
MPPLTANAGYDNYARQRTSVWLIPQEISDRLVWGKRRYVRGVLKISAAISVGPRIYPII